MSDVDVSLDFSSPADAVWKELADFGGIGAWAPGVVSCKLTGSGVGAVRAIEMPGGAVMEERLEALDESGELGANIGNTFIDLSGASAAAVSRTRPPGASPSDVAPPSSAIAASRKSCLSKQRTTFRDGTAPVL